jgi:hypothetical protein
MGYDTEFITDTEKEVFKINGKMAPVNDFIQIPEEVEEKVRVDDKKLFIDGIEEIKEEEVEVSNEQEHKRMTIH